MYINNRYRYPSSLENRWIMGFSGRFFEKNYRNNYFNIVTRVDGIQYRIALCKIFAHTQMVESVVVEREWLTVTVMVKHCKQPRDEGRVSRRPGF